MPAYSFLDVVASFSGPGGNIDLKGSNSEEGITIEQTGDKNIMTVGADGAVMHSLRGDNSGTVTVRLLKTSPINAQLEQIYNSQKGSASTWGQNTISVKDMWLGDDITCSECAFAKEPSSTFATEGGTVEWAFHSGKIDRVLGSGGAV
ncbi:MAG: DUF3277 family protein [Synergistaceae bacterium]|jgi:hypothetical protein|nr:DUF3277 family protein [Synergistaceae bacterium]